MNNVIELFPLGYCADCKRPIVLGQVVCDVPLPGGKTAPVHRACLEGSDTEPPEPRPVTA